MTRRQYNQRQHKAEPIRSELRAVVCHACETSCRPSDVIGYWAGQERRCSACGDPCSVGTVVVARGPT